MIKELVQSINFPYYSEQDKQTLVHEFKAQQIYEPFHLDCKITKRKICYCKYQIPQMFSQRQRLQLGKGLGDVKRFFTKIKKDRKEWVLREESVLRDKVRMLERQEVNRFVKKQQ